VINMLVLPLILKTAIVAGIVVAIIAWIATYLNAKSASPFPGNFIWLIAFAVWILWVFFGGGVSWS